VPCRFRLLVYEATQVPPGCQTLSVAWRKGNKVVSTGAAAVREGRAEWERTIAVSCVLFRGAVRDGQVQFEAKFCWLEVTRDGGGVLGHAQLDLADFCDGQAHERVLQVWKPNSSVGSLRLRVSIEAHGPGLAGPALAPAPAPPELLAVAPEATWPPAMPTGAEAAAAAAAAAAVSPLPATAPSPAEDLETLVQSGALRLAPCPEPTPGPAAVAVPTAPRRSREELRQLPLRALLTPGAGHSLGTTAAAATGHAGAITPAAEAASAYATALKGLPARLVALCNRQCLASNLTSVQQEDALRLFVAELKRAREPSKLCGILFSAVPAQAVPAASVTSVAALGAGSIVGGRDSPRRPASPRQGWPAQPASPSPGSSACAASPCPASPPQAAVTCSLSLGPQAAVSACAGRKRMGSSLDSRLLPITTAAERAEADEGQASPGAATGPHACTRHLYELLSHLSDVRSLALALERAAGPAAAAVEPAPEPAEPAAEPVAEVAAGQEAVALPVAGPGAAVVLVAAAAAGAAAALAQEPAAEEPGDEAVRTAAAVAGQEAQPQAPGRPASSGTAPTPGAPQEAGEVVSQIVQGVDQAVAVGGRALEQAGSAFGDLLMRLHEVSRDRELWVHRFLAVRELQYSSALCERATRLERGEFWVPVAA